MIPELPIHHQQSIRDPDVREVEGYLKAKDYTKAMETLEVYRLGGMAGFLFFFASNKWDY